jgi:hypothetical protein
MAFHLIRVPINQSTPYLSFLFHFHQNYGGLSSLSMLAYAEIWLMLMCYERKTLFIG